MVDWWDQRWVEQLAECWEVRRVAWMAGNLVATKGARSAKMMAVVMADLMTGKRVGRLVDQLAALTEHKKAGNSAECWASQKAVQMAGCWAPGLAAGKGLHLVVLMATQMAECLAVEKGDC